MKDSIEQIYKDMRLSPIEYLVKQNIHLSLPTDNGYTDSDFYLFRNIMKRNIEERIKKSSCQIDKKYYIIYIVRKRKR